MVMVGHGGISNSLLWLHSIEIFNVSHHVYVTLHSYDQSVRHVEEVMEELRDDINERKKVTTICVLFALFALFTLFPCKILIAGLAQIRDQRTQQCDHMSTQYSNFMRQLTEVSTPSRSPSTTDLFRWCLRPKHR